MNVISSIVAKLGLNTLEWDSGVEKAKRGTKEIKQSFTELKVGALAVGASFAFIAKDVMAYADSLNDVADANDVSISQVVKLSNALQASGGEADNASKLFSSFTKYVDDAANAGKDAQKSFADVGISLKDLSTLSQQDLMDKALKNLSQIEDPIKRNAIAMDMFGRAARGVDMKRLNAEMENSVGLTAKQEQAFKDLGDVVDKFERQQKSAYTAMAEGFAPAVKMIADQVNSMGGAFNEVILVVGKATEGIVFMAVSAVEAVKWSVRAMSNVLTAAGNAMNPFAKEGFMETLGRLGEANNENFKSNMKEIVSSGQPNESSKRGGGASSGRSVEKVKSTDKTLNDLLSIYKVSDELAARFDNTINNINVKMAEMVMMTQEEVEITRTLNDIENQRVDTIGKLEVKLAEAKEKNASQKVIDAILKEIDQVNALAEAYSRTAAIAKAAEYERQMSAEAGWASASRKYQQMSINSSAAITESVDAMFNGLTSAMDNFVQTGKFSFKDFANSVIQDILRIQLRMAMAGLISKAIGAFSGAFSTTPGISTNDAYMGPPTASVAASMGTRAGGGDVTAGNAYVVGEKGPELFYPQSDGAIQPNSAMARGGTTVVQNFNIQAIDPSSFNQKVLGVIGQNAKTVFSAVKEGERQMGSVSFA